MNIAGIIRASDNRKSKFTTTNVARIIREYICNNLMLGLLFDRGGLQ